MTPEGHGIYHTVRLQLHGGEIRALSQAYYWSVTFDGDHLVDIPHAETPDGDGLLGCRLVVCDDASGRTVVAGEITEVGREDGIGGLTTVVVNIEPVAAEVAGAV